MKTTLLLFFMSISFFGYAQTPISNYDSAPLSMYAVVSSSTAVNHNATGANQSWSFNTLSQIDSSADSHTAPTAQELIDYPTTTSVATTTSTSSVGKVYTKNIANQVSITGAEGAGLILNYITDNALIGTLPLSFGYSNTDTVAGTFDYNGSVTGTFSGTLTSEVDAYGTLIMNDLGSGTFNGSVTRLKTTQNITLSAGFISGTVDQTSYYYYHATTGDLVFRSTTVSIVAPGINSTDTIMESLLSSTLGVNQTISNVDLQLYPNPVKDRLNLNLDNDIDSSSISILDINGRQISNFETNQNAIDVSRLKSGIYFISILTTKGFVTKKFIKL